MNSSICYDIIYYMVSYDESLNDRNQDAVLWCSNSFSTTTTTTAGIERTVQIQAGESDLRDLRGPRRPRGGGHRRPRPDLWVWTFSLAHLFRTWSSPDQDPPHSWSWIDFLLMNKLLRCDLYFYLLCFNQVIKWCISKSWRMSSMLWKEISPVSFIVPGALHINTHHWVHLQMIFFWWTRLLLYKL